MAIFADAAGANMIGRHALATQSRRRRMAGSATSRCAFENPPRMAAVAIGTVMGTVQREPC